MKHGYDCRTCPRREACRKLGKRARVRFGGLCVCEMKPGEFESWGDTK